jgi:hypothetical protein
LRPDDEEDELRLPELFVRDEDDPFDRDELERDEPFEDEPFERDEPFEEPPDRDEPPPDRDEPFEEPPDRDEPLERDELDREAAAVRLPPRLDSSAWRLNRSVRERWSSLSCSESSDSSSS